MSVPAGVAEAQDGTSSVKPPRGRTQGEVQVPRAYRRPATVVRAVGELIRSLPPVARVPSKVP
jgi:hypothetical protein